MCSKKKGKILFLTRGKRKPNPGGLRKFERRIASANCFVAGKPRLRLSGRQERRQRSLEGTGLRNLGCRSGPEARSKQKGGGQLADSMVCVVGGGAASSLNFENSIDQMIFDS